MKRLISWFIAIILAFAILIAGYVVLRKGDSRIAPFHAYRVSFAWDHGRTQMRIVPVEYAFGPAFSVNEREEETIRKQARNDLSEVADAQHLSTFSGSIDYSITDDPMIRLHYFVGRSGISYLGRISGWQQGRQSNDLSLKRRAVLSATARLKRGYAE